MNIIQGQNKNYVFPISQNTRQNDLTSNSNTWYGDILVLSLKISLFFNAYVSYNDGMFLEQESFGGLTVMLSWSTLVAKTELYNLQITKYMLIYLRSEHVIPSGSFMGNYFLSLL